MEKVSIIHQIICLGYLALGLWALIFWANLSRIEIIKWYRDLSEEDEVEHINDDVTD